MLHPANPPTSVATTTAQQGGSKEPPNTATICRIGQETVQEIVTRWIFLNFGLFVVLNLVFSDYSSL
jgi:hypothetical protein